MFFAIVFTLATVFASTPIDEIKSLDESCFAIKAHRTKGNDDPLYIVYSNQESDFVLSKDPEGTKSKFLLQFDFKTGMVSLFNILTEKFLELHLNSRSYEKSIDATTDYKKALAGLMSASRVIKDRDNCFFIRS